MNLRLERHYESRFGAIGSIYDDVGVLFATREAKPLPDGIYHDKSLFGQAIEVGLGSNQAVLFHRDKALAQLKARIHGKPITLIVGEVTPLAV